MTDIFAEFLGTSKSNNGFLGIYQKLADHIGPAGHVLEIGVQKGDSLRLWQRLFPEGLVAGADNDTDHEGPSVWPQGTLKFFANQDDPELARMAQKASPGGYDMIVDDASHQGDLTRATFDMLWPQIKPGKWYVIEDWSVGYLPGYKDKYGDSMLRMAESLLPLIDGYPYTQPREADFIQFYPGLIIIHKRPGPKMNWSRA